MRLGDILRGRSNIFIKEYEIFGNMTIFAGACYYGDNKLISIDSKSYTFDMEISHYNWTNGNVLQIMR